MSKNSPSTLSNNNKSIDELTEGLLKPFIGRNPLAKKEINEQLKPMLNGLGREYFKAHYFEIRAEIDKILPGSSLTGSQVHRQSKEIEKIMSKHQKASINQNDDKTLKAMKENAPEIFNAKVEAFAKKYLKNYKPSTELTNSDIAQLRLKHPKEFDQLMDPNVSAPQIKVTHVEANLEPVEGAAPLKTTLNKTVKNIVHDIKKSGVSVDPSNVQLDEIFEKHTTAQTKNLQNPEFNQTKDASVAQHETTTKKAFSQPLTPYESVIKSSSLKPPPTVVTPPMMSVPKNLQQPRLNANGMNDRANLIESNVNANVNTREDNIKKIKENAEKMKGDTSRDVRTLNEQIDKLRATKAANEAPSPSQASEPKPAPAPLTPPPSIVTPALEPKQLSSVSSNSVKSNNAYTANVEKIDASVSVRAQEKTDPKVKEPAVGQQKKSNKLSQALKSMHNKLKQFVGQSSNKTSKTSPSMTPHQESHKSDRGR